MPFDLMSGFQIGQQLGGGSTLGAFVRQLTAHAQAIMEQRAKVATEVETQRQVLPLKEASDIRIEQAKAQTASRTAQETLQALRGGTGIGAGLGGALPPGTTLGLDTGAGRLTFPLNRELSGDDAQTVSKAIGVRAEVEKGKALLAKTGPVTQGLSYLPGVGAAADLFHNRGLARAEAMQRIPSNLKVLLGFTLGGKTFSPTEQKAVMGLIDPRGKSDAQATEDLEKGARIAEYAAQLIQNGQASAKSWADVLRDVGVSTADFEERLGLTTPPTTTSATSLRPLSGDLQSQALQELQRRRARGR